MTRDRQSPRNAKENSVELSPRESQQILIEYLHDNPWQPRTVIKQDDLRKLVTTIERYGFSGNLEARLDPLNPERYQLVWGHRRRDAAGLAGLQSLPVVIRDYDDKTMAELGLLENHTQEPLSYFDEGKAFLRLHEEHGYKLRDIASVFGVSLGYITNRIGIARLPEDSPLVEAAKNGQADMSSLLTLRYLEKDITPESIRELLDAAVRGELSSDQLYRVREAVKQVNKNLHLVSEDSDGKLRYTITVEQAKQIDEHERAQRQAQRRAKEEAYRQITARERAGTAVPLDELNLFGRSTVPAPASASANSDHTTVLPTPESREADGSEKSAAALPRDEQHWTVFLLAKLREVVALIPPQDPETAPEELTPALQEACQHVVMVILQLLHPSPHRL